ncbi:RNA-binding protein 12B isoform X2 [Tachyglossus aculeatus]|nr:RNA-binding protein 12B isoform X2 [Tachyglossus aculeatus]XP_038601269.1 RNA-binding protein 12B isoform X2 [Tachyglossus aculeatus]
MAVVIRLQGLPVVAGPVDIRHFFSGLNIPDGGVHIIGGEIGEAFIIFATDEDARRAMSCSGGFIKDSLIELFLSSKTEMQNTIEMSRKRFDRGGRDPPGCKRPGSGISGASGLSSLSSLVEAIKKGMSKPGAGNPEAGFHTNGTRHGDSGSRKDTRPFKPEDRYLFLHGMPYSVTEDEVHAFFSGLRVDGVLLLKHHNGRNNGDGLVRFATAHDALGGLQRHRRYMGPRFVEISPASERQWVDSGGGLGSEMEVGRIRSKERSPPRGIGDLRLKKRSRSRSPRRLRTRSRSPRSPGFYVHLKNLSLSTEKKDIKGFFRNIDLTSNQIKFLYKDQKRTRSAFVMFKTLRDYNEALCLHKAVMRQRPVHVDPISKKTMLKFIDAYERRGAGALDKERPSQAMPDKSYREGYPGPKLCVYIRNFPFDVTKIEVQKFFAGFPVEEEDVYLLYDDKGVGLGEALVRFRSEERALEAETLNRKRFLGTEVLLRLISEKQMQEFGVSVPLMPGEKIQDHSRAYERDGRLRSMDGQGPPMASFGPPGAFRHPPDDFGPLDRFRPPPEEFLRPPGEFRALRPFLNFGPEGEPFGRLEFGKSNLGGFPEGRFLPDPNFSCGSGRITPVKIRNLPFKATVNEILDFFHGYRVIPESVSIQFNEQGLPSGDAIVAMTDYDEAVAAINELNDRPVGPRKVKLLLL